MSPFGSSEVSITTLVVSGEGTGRDPYAHGCWTAYCDGDGDRAAQRVPGQSRRFESFLRTYSNSSSRNLGGTLSKAVYQEDIDVPLEREVSPQSLIRNVPY